MKRGTLPKKIAVKNAGRLKVAVVVSDYYEEITDELLNGALEVLTASGVKKKNISIKRVPGSFEIVYGCQQAIKDAKPHVVITLGCLIKGETAHDAYIAHAVAQGITHLIVKHGIPISFGVITANTYAQAAARSQGDMNKGREAAIAALVLFARTSETRSF